MASKTLVIETGLTCTNHCIFCYQKGLREAYSETDEVSWDWIKKSLIKGIKEGFTEVSFIGGEVTIRPDFLQMVRFAREIGYQGVSVTTNGWMLSNKDFFDAAVESGLTSLGVSIHGNNSQVHDGLTGRKGSFEHAILTIRNAVSSPLRNRLNTFTLVNKRNVGHLMEIAKMIEYLGVKLLVFQPVVLSKSNFEDAAQIRLPLQDVVEAVREVARYAEIKGFRVKPYNLPPCLFSKHLTSIEFDHYEIINEKANTKRDGLRFSACDACKIKCEGIDVTLVPEEDVVFHLVESASALIGEKDKGLWLVGTDLLGNSALRKLIRRVRDMGFRKVIVTNGGTCLWGIDDISNKSIGSPDQIVLVSHPKNQKSNDKMIARKGNTEFINKVAQRITSVPKQDRPKVGVLVDYDETGLEIMEGLYAILGEIDVYVRGGSIKTKNANFDHSIRCLGIGRPKVLPASLEDKETMLRFHNILGALDYPILDDIVLQTVFAKQQMNALSWSLPYMSTHCNHELVIRSLDVKPFRKKPCL